jgi:hypothetical protein
MLVYAMTKFPAAGQKRRGFGHLKDFETMAF